MTDFSSLSGPFRDGYKLNEPRHGPMDDGYRDAGDTIRNFEAPPTDGGGSLAGVASIAQVASTLSSAIGTHYQMQAQRSALRSQALSLDFAKSVAGINAGRAEDEARAILEAGQRERAAITLRQGQEQAAVMASQAASGTALDSGSNAEVRASQKLVNEIDKDTQQLNTVRAANAARAKGVGLRSDSSLLGQSARNVQVSAGTIKPGVGAVASLLGSAGTIADRWVYRDRARGYYGDD